MNNTELEHEIQLLKRNFEEHIQMLIRRVGQLEEDLQRAFRVMQRRPFDDGGY